MPTFIQQQYQSQHNFFHGEIQTNDEGYGTRMHHNGPSSRLATPQNTPRGSMLGMNWEWKEIHMSRMLKCTHSSKLWQIYKEDDININLTTEKSVSKKSIDIRNVHMRQRWYSGECSPLFWVTLLPFALDTQWIWRSWSQKGPCVCVCVCAPNANKGCEGHKEF